MNDLKDYLYELTNAHQKYPNNKTINQLKDVLKDVFKKLLERIEKNDPKVQDQELAGKFGLDSATFSKLKSNDNYERGKGAYYKAIAGAINEIYRLEQSKREEESEIKLKGLEKELIQSSEEIQRQNVRLRKTKITNIAAIVLSLIVLALSYYLYQANLRYEEYEYWSTVMEKPDETNSDSIMYKEIMRPILSLANSLNEEKSNISKIVTSLTDNTLVNRAIYYLTELEKDPKRTLFRNTLRYNEDLVYSKIKGVYVLAPTPKEFDSLPPSASLQQMINAFRLIDNELDVLSRNDAGNESELIPFLEKTLGISETKKNVIRPVLIYCLNLTDIPIDSLKRRQIDLDSLVILMYRFPAYIEKDYEEKEAADYLSPYLGYQLWERQYIEDFLNGNVLTIDTVKRVMLSSIYQDFNTKTAKPIRTLMIDRQANGKRFLFCIDFKFDE